MTSLSQFPIKTDNFPSLSALQNARVTEPLRRLQSFVPPHTLRTFHLLLGLNRATPVAKIEPGTRHSSLAVRHPGLCNMLLVRTCSIMRGIRSLVFRPQKAIYIPKKEVDVRVTMFVIWFHGVCSFFIGTCASLKTQHCKVELVVLLSLAHTLTRALVDHSKVKKPGRCCWHSAAYDTRYWYTDGRSNRCISACVKEILKHALRHTNIILDVSFRSGILSFLSSKRAAFRVVNIAPVV